MCQQLRLRCVTGPPLTVHGGVGLNCFPPFSPQEQHLLPAQRYEMPITASQEVGWHSKPMPMSTASRELFHKPRGAGRHFPQPSPISRTISPRRPGPLLTLTPCLILHRRRELRRHAVRERVLRDDGDNAVLEATRGSGYINQAESGIRDALRRFLRAWPGAAAPFLRRQPRRRRRVVGEWVGALADGRLLTKTPRIERGRQ